jgi:hypothetical protein
MLDPMRIASSARFITSDAKSLGGVSPHDGRFVLGRAFAAGAPSYARALGRLREGDLLFLWADTLGVVAVGRALATFDGAVHDADAWSCVPPFPDAGREYRLPVYWFPDLRHKPPRTHDVKRLGIRSVNPRGFLSRVSNLHAALVAANALTAFAAVQDALDPMRDR